MLLAGALLMGAAPSTSADEVSRRFGRLTIRVDTRHARPGGLLTVRFESSYADLSRLLSRIESPTSPIRIRSVEIHRHLLDVRVKLGLDQWTGREIRS